MDATTLESNLDMEIATLESAILDTAKLQSIIEMDLKTRGSMSQQILATALECDEEDSENASSGPTSDPPDGLLGKCREKGRQGASCAGVQVLGEALVSLLVLLLLVPLGLLSAVLCLLVVLLIQVPGSIYVLGSLSFQYTITHATHIAQWENNIDTDPRLFCCIFSCLNWMMVKIPLILTVAVLHLVQFVALLPATYFLLVYKTLKESILWDEPKFRELVVKRSDTPPVWQTRNSL